MIAQMKTPAKELLGFHEVEASEWGWPNVTKRRRRLSRKQRRAQKAREEAAVMAKEHRERVVKKEGLGGE